MCLEVPELPVLAAAGKELCVRTHLCDSSVFEYYDLIRIHNGGESVRDHHARAPAASISAHLLALAARDVAQHLEDLALGERVHRARRLARGGGGGGGGGESFSWPFGFRVGFRVCSLFVRVLASRALSFVTSSHSSTGASLSSARAMAILCFSPPESLRPLSPTSVA